MASRKRKSDQTDEPTEDHAEVQAEEAPTEPEPEPEAVTADQMLRIKRASEGDLEALLVPGFPEHMAAAVRGELGARRARSAKAPVIDMVRVTEARMRRTRDGFFTEVKEGSTFPLEDEQQLQAEGFKLERVKMQVVENEMGNPRMRLA